jgi:ABC-2 type transport system permease protein
VLRKIIRIAGRELTGFFASPAAVLFLAAFLGVTLFIFFWVATFFERNLADVRPLFQWMPVLLIFLVAALTMRSWAEERRSGTLELLLTSPTAPTEHVLGKFLGAMVLVLIALALTLPLPITVSFLGALDWGPVIGGYAAAIVLAASYVAIGLWVSSRTDNQIVSLILTVVIAGLFYLVGSDALVSLGGYRTAEWLHALGAGSRFASIQRGVLDLRDIYYYLSITATFLLLNRLALERLRWAGNPSSADHRRWYWAVGLLSANLLGANLWLGQITAARVDLTAGHMYTLSDATRGYLTQLQEPLLIRGYFSAATHPLLAPLVPQLHDLLQEYAVAGGSKVHVEFVDPHDDAKVEAEAGSRYGIRPVPFQVSGKYSSQIVNSYFDILVAYGDQYQVINYRDLIDVKVRDEQHFDVELKNPEYAVTSAIRKVLLSYQGGGNPFDAVQQPLTFSGYLTATQNLPEGLQSARAALERAVQQVQQEAGDKLKVQIQDPSADSALASRLTRDYGFRPMVVSLLDPKSFWFYMTLSSGHETEQVPLPQAADQASFKSAIEDAVKRFSPGILKTVAVVSPAPNEPSQFSQFMPQQSASFSVLRNALSTSVRWLDTDLQSGRVPNDADMLMVLDPKNLDQKQVFAIDQFLMQGGTVLIATSPTDVQLGRSLSGEPVKTGLEDWLHGNAVSVGPGLMLDAQSGALPIPIQRNVGGFTVEEIELATYPYIVDVRGSGLDTASPITSGLGQIEVPWGAPIAVDAAHDQGRKLTVLLRSSPAGWSSRALSQVPD